MKPMHTRRSVKALIGLPPLFCTSVRGITSIASATALKGQPSIPVTLRALACRPTLIAISVAPPPGARMGLKKTFRATDIASARLRSISLRMSFEGPRSNIVHALGVLHSTRKVKYLLKRSSAVRYILLIYFTYSSPIFSTLKSPHFVPTSDSRKSSARLTMVAPVARAIRLLSDLRTRLNADTPACSRTYCATSSE